MIDLARKLDKADREALSRAAMHLTKMEQYSFAAEVYSKMGDIKALINLHVEAKHWEDVSQRLFLSNSSFPIILLFSAEKDFVFKNIKY